LRDINGVWVDYDDDRLIMGHGATGALAVSTYSVSIDGRIGV